jgi:NAD(P)-dependent dehydrogenase (short-subunit alcohol dehydrogenase family)
MSEVLIVTGSSRGIGAALARAGGKRGFDVCVNYNTNPALAEEVVADIREAGAKAVAVHANMMREEDIVRMFETVDRELGLVTALVNNAGITARRCLVEEVDAASLEACFMTNIAAYFLCGREAIKRMSIRKGGKGGRIVNISSVAALLTNAFTWLHYGASKAAIDTFTRGLALETAPDGIRVNAIRPGMIDTDINPPGRIAAALHEIPMRRAGTLDEVVAAVMWLLSDEASYCTGAILDVAGGRGI